MKFLGEIKGSRVLRGKSTNYLLKVLNCYLLIEANKLFVHKYAKEIRYSGQH